MSKPKHTPEPWKYTDDPSDGCCWTHHVETVARDPQMPDYAHGSVADISGEENARRIVACVNACAGIPTEALEAGVIGDAYAALSDVLNQGIDRQTIRTIIERSSEVKWWLQE